MSVKLIGSRTGIRLNVESVSKDAMGFDDLDEFWNATELAATTPSRSRRSSAGGVGSASRRETGVTEITTFDYYDEGDSITEPESEEEEDEEEEEMGGMLSTTSSRRSTGSPGKSPPSKRGVQSPGSSTKSTPDNLTTGRGRRSSDRETLNTDTPFGDNGMDVSMDSGSRRSSKQGASPFDAGTSPVGTSMSAISSGRKSSRGRPSYGDDDVDDDYGGYGDYDDDQSDSGSENDWWNQPVSYGQSNQGMPGSYTGTGMQSGQGFGPQNHMGQMGGGPGSMDPYATQPGFQGGPGGMPGGMDPYATQPGFQGAGMQAGMNYGGGPQMGMGAPMPGMMAGGGGPQQYWG